jgi:S1-C subfamily serine protease
MRSISSRGIAAAGARVCARFYAAVVIAFVVVVAGAAAVAGNRVDDNIVKVFTTSNSYNYYTPWQMVGPRNYEGSGCIIKGRLILTNAHVVSDHTFITVKRSGQTKKYVARVKYVAHECDLAVLSVDDQKFFPSDPPLDIGDLPRVTDEVAVYGYPNGTDQLTITKGIVSRVSHEVYSHGSASLLACQIDAPINDGNSGGPVMAGDKIVGIAMMMGYGENEGYMVSVPVIEHFLKDISDGTCNGVPDLAIQTQMMENPSLRRFYGMKEEQSGVLVRDIFTDSPAKDLVEPGDVLLAVDGTEIASDGTVSFREDERTSYVYTVQNKQIGESVLIRILRGGKIEEVTVKLTIASGAYRLVPNTRFDEEPAYFIYGGFVFSPLTVNLLKEWGNEWWHDAPLNFLYQYMQGEPTETQREVVVIVDVLSDEINMGYEQAYWEIVVFANGKRIGRLRDLVDALESNKGPYQVIETLGKSQIIIDRKDAEKNAKRILKQYKIGSDRSEGLRRGR